MRPDNLSLFQFCYKSEGKRTQPPFSPSVFVRGQFVVEKMCETAEKHGPFFDDDFPRMSRTGSEDQWLGSMG